MTTHWLTPAGTSCGPCEGGTRPTACAAGLGPACGAPRLTGPRETLDRLMAQLARVPCAEDGRGLVEAGQVVSLRVSPDEAELVLNLPRGCGRQRLAAELAFQVLRQALPDTDVYVTLAA